MTACDCGYADVPEGAIACPNCGRPTRQEAESVHRTTPPAASVVAERPADESVQAGAYPCGHRIEEGRATCPHCSPRRPAAGRSEDVALAVEAPWGTIDVPASGLCLGRDPDFSPHATALSGALNVSRRHAVILPGEGGLLVEDHSQNGTFVDGVRVGCGETRTAPFGAEIRLGTSPPVVLVVVRR